jgi:hypothetical protein
MYQACALAAALLGWLYFSLYHCCLRPRCGRKTPPSQELATDGEPKLNIKKKTKNMLKLRKIFRNVPYYTILLYVNHKITDTKIIIYLIY